MSTLELTTPSFPTPSASSPGGIALGFSGGDPAILERNLAALARTSIRTAQLVRSCAPRADLRFLPTEDSVPTIELVDPIGLSPPRALASRRRPLREAEQLSQTIDISESAAIGVMGFAAGYHVAALARRMRRTGVIAVFEPDIPLLRAVLERIDHSDWLAASNTAVFTDPDDAATISASLSGVEGIVMMGLSLLEHAPSADRLAGAKTRFYTNLQDVIRAVRTTVATTMVQVQATVGNLVRNLPWYVSSPGIAELAGSRRGTPAIVVSAGPSLQRNIAELARPGVAERFTIIAAQTVLKPLLARGIRPHFVVALDHSEISARFYEGLTARDVEEVTLVIEPKVSPAVPLAFPSSGVQIRLARDPFLDSLLGAELTREMGTLPPGATVAHLAYYLARHLGADPVVLVGQDLGFTDGQYYAAGAAIHDVWACELNEFNSLERMEWERIRRMGGNLRRATDYLGRPIFTDEQLATYLVQFERDFQADAARGLTIIDATEGGVAKRHTSAEPLSAVIDRVLASPAGASPLGTSTPRHLDTSPRSARRVEERVRTVQRDAHSIGELSRKTVGLLQEMLEHHSDQARVGRLIGQVHALRDKVEGLKPAMELVHYLNQAGAFTRIRADRSIRLDEKLTPLQRQRREIERDIANVEQLVQSAEQLGEHLGVAADALVRWQSGAARTLSYGTKRIRSTEKAAPAHAVIALDARSLRTALTPLAGHVPLRLTLERLSRAELVQGIVLLTADPAAVAPHLKGLPARVTVRVQRTDADLFGPDHARLRAARAPALDCWRSGLASASIFDEVLAPEPTLHAMEELGIDLALIVGPDWCLVDPALTDGVIARLPLLSGVHRLAFSQAPPGAAGCVVNRALLTDLIKLRRGSSPFATIGGVLGYVPSAASLDPCGRDACAPIDAALRDAGVRLIPDSPSRAAVIARALATLGSERAATASTLEILPLLRDALAAAPLPPGHLTLELSCAADGSRTNLGDDALGNIIADFVAAAPGALLTLRDDALDVARLGRLLAAARAAGDCHVHVRTAVSLPIDPGALLAFRPDIISVDFPTAPDSPQWHAASRALESLASGRPATWVVPRLTKCDATYGALEGFFDRWLLATGAVALDPVADGSAGQRLTPLPLPRAARRRFARSCMYVRTDAGTYPDELFDRSPHSTRPAADLRRDSLVDAWNSLRAARAHEGEGP